MQMRLFNYHLNSKVIYTILCTSLITLLCCKEDAVMEEAITPPQETKQKNNKTPLEKEPDNWELISSLSDEFNSNLINASKWDNDPGSWGPWSWRTTNTYQAGGKLAISMKYDPHTRGGNQLYYTSGIVRSMDTLTYGYFEAKVKGCDVFPGTAPAFWTYSLNHEVRGMNDSITYSEIDIMEIQQGEYSIERKEYNDVKVIDCNLHTRVMVDGVETWKRPNGYPDICKNEWHAPWDPRDDYHIYSCESRPDSITWYIDGEKVAQKKNIYWHLPMHVTLSMGLRRPHVQYIDGNRLPVPEEATSDGFPTTMLVDWVRVYKKKP